MRHRPTTGITRPAAAILASSALLLGVAACGTDDTGDPPATAPGTGNTEGGSTGQPGGGTGGDGTGFATAALRTPDGSDAGTVTFSEEDGAVHVSVDARGLEPGFRGFHIHAIGKCEPDSEPPGGGESGNFMSAGGHLTGDSDKEGHGNPDATVGHAGDMPSLLVNEDGTATMTFRTDRLTRDLLLDDDGSSVMIHEGPDNFAHIPERYAPDGPDEDTKSTGDAGARALCGVVEER